MEGQSDYQPIKLTGLIIKKYVLIVFKSILDNRRIVFDFSVILLDFLGGVLIACSVEPGSIVENGKALLHANEGMFKGGIATIVVSFILKGAEVVLRSEKTKIVIKNIFQKLPWSPNRIRQ